MVQKEEKNLNETAVVQEFGLSPAGSVADAGWDVGAKL